MSRKLLLETYFWQTSHFDSFQAIRRQGLRIKLVMRKKNKKIANIGHGWVLTRDLKTVSWGQAAIKDGSDAKQTAWIKEV